MTGRPPFAPVARRTVAEEVRDRIIDSIRRAELAPGARVPAERVLCEEFGVARTSVREAILMLVSMRLIERRGNRTFVVEHLPSVDLSADRRKTTVRELFETRRVIEMPMVELAVERATDEQRSAIVALARQFEPAMALDEFRRLDHRFHRAIAGACGNPLLAEVYGKVLTALFASDEFSSLLHASTNRDEVAVIVERASAAHGAIAAAIDEGDPVAGLVSVEAHLRDVEHRMVERLV